MTIRFLAEKMTTAEIYSSKENAINTCVYHNFLNSVLVYRDLIDLSMNNPILSSTEGIKKKIPFRIFREFKVCFNLFNFVIIFNYIFNIYFAVCALKFLSFFAHGKFLNVIGSVEVNARWHRNRR